MGTYLGLAGSDTDVHQVESEDLHIAKSVSGTLTQSTVVTNTLTISASEYRDYSNLVVRDLLPSSMCFLGTYSADASGSDWNTNDCPGAGTVPSTINGVAVAAARVRELPSGGPYGTGRFEIVWDLSSSAALNDLDADRTITISYATVVRQDYRGGLARLTTEPVLAGDSVTNEAEVSGPDIAADVSLPAAEVSPDGGVDGDTASASIANGSATLDKRVSVKAGPLADGVSPAATGSSCGSDYALITWQQGDPTPAAGYGPGDIICFELNASFPANMDYEGVVVSDILPSGYEYVVGSATRISGDTLAETTFDEGTRLVTFNLDGGVVESEGNTFRWVIAARMVDNSEGAALDIDANLQKMVYNNNGGLVFQLRDQSAAEWTEPEVRLAKGVSAIDSADDGIDQTGLGPDIDGSLTGGSTAMEVQSDAIVTYRIDVWNEGNKEAIAGEVQDVLPTGFTCGDVNLASISNGGTCSGSRITWTGLTIGSSVDSSIPDLVPDDETTAPLTLTYSLQVPSDVDPGQTYVNNAGVVTYQAASNTGLQNYYPANNIDPTNAALENTDAADDPAYIRTAAPTVAKTQKSGYDEGGNVANEPSGTANDEATIGEVIEYTVTATVPEGTTVFGAELRDVLPSGLVYFEGNALFDGVVQNLQPSVVSGDDDGAGTPLDSGTLTHPASGSGGTIRYALPATYRNEVGDGADTLVLTFYAQVDDVAANQADPTARRLRNLALFDWDDSGGADRPDVQSNATDTYVVEPNPVIDKIHTTPSGIVVSPGDVVTYQVTVSNPTTATNVSTAHDLTVVDSVPLGLTPLGLARYRLTVTNHGPSPTRGLAVLTDVLPTGLTFVSATAPAGVSCTSRGQIVDCELPSDLANRATVVIDLTVRVTAKSGTAIVNIASVAGGNEVNGTPLADGVIGLLDDDIRSALGIPTTASDQTDTATATVLSSLLAFTGSSAGFVLGLAAALLQLGFMLLGLGRLRSRPAEQRVG